MIINLYKQVGISLSNVLLGKVDGKMGPKMNDVYKKDCNFLKLVILFILSLVAILKITIVPLKVQLPISTLCFEIL